MTIRFTIDAENIEDLFDQLPNMLPEIYTDVHSNKLSGGDKMSWKIHDVTKEREIMDQCKKQKSCRDCPKLEICHPKKYERN